MKDSTVMLAVKAGIEFIFRMNISTWECMRGIGKTWQKKHKCAKITCMMAIIICSFTQASVFESIYCYTLSLIQSHSLGWIDQIKFRNKEEMLEFGMAVNFSYTLFFFTKVKHESGCFTENHILDRLWSFFMFPSIKYVFLSYNM